MANLGHITYFCYWCRMYILMSKKHLNCLKKIPVGARFFAHVQIGPEAHPASCAMGTGSFLGVKRPERGADYPPRSSAEVKKE
jgi:hypothetical protein